MTVSQKPWNTVVETCGARLVQNLPTLAARSHTSESDVYNEVSEPGYTL